MTVFNPKFMSYGLNLAKKNLGITASNPCVGCVIVKNDVIIATGITAKNGRPHAEKAAIDKVLNKEILKDADLYVTLEPCCHKGRDVSCCDEIIKYGFKRVIIATKDLDQRMNGQGIIKLKNAEIEVEYGVLEEKAQDLYRAFFKARQTKIPYITLKLAVSLDGKIADKNFQSKWITNEKSRKFAHHLRSINDGILVGGNTIRKDNPSLDCRIKGLEDYSPKKIVISNSGIFDKNLKIFQNPSIFITNCNDLPNTVEIINCENKNNSIDLKEALKKLYLKGLNSILVEGGSMIATEFLKENLVDKLIVMQNDKIIGNDGISALAEFDINNILKENLGFYLKETKEFDGDVCKIYTKI